ncbi:MAG TPA: hypothetical protein VNU93_09175 [Verrucomicrobiae bacterium]|nr:hypothetical protein [Verrucomicrobiae bacterium]
MRENFSNKKMKRVNLTMRKFLLIAALAAMAIVVTAGAAFAFNGHPCNSTVDAGAWDGQSATTYETYEPADECEACHGGGGHGGYAGPHGGYTTATKKCTTCHVLHSNVADNGRVATVATAKLLPGRTVTDVCNFCHDLTGSVRAPYSAAKLTDHSEVQSAHRVEGATPGAGLSLTVSGSVYADDAYMMDYGNGTIPGGDVADGGTLPYNDFFNQGEWSGKGADSVATFTCDSCHTPHAIDGAAVTPYFGESERKGRSATYIIAGSRLLKKNLYVGQADAVDNYSSEWCAGCHQGRLSMAGSNYNHPVDTAATGYNLGMVAFKTVGETAAINVYSANVPGATEAEEIAAINAGQAVTPGATIYETAEDVVGFPTPTYYLGIGTTSSAQVIKNERGGVDADNPIVAYLNRKPLNNSWYTMTSTDPITGSTRPDGYIPITEFTNGPACQQCHASARNVEAAFAGNFAGAGAPSMGAATFPHISKNQYLLVEANTDDLCTNCHGLDNLP